MSDEVTIEERAVMVMVAYIFFFPPFLPLLIRLFFPTAILGKDGRHDAATV